MVALNNKVKRVIVEGDLRNFFYDQLFQMNRKFHGPLDEKILFYSSSVLEKYSISENYFDCENGRVREKILGEKLLKVKNQGKEAQKTILKDVGDTCLFLCGYFAESLNKKLNDLSYYQNVGKNAYVKLNSLESSVLGVGSFYKIMSIEFEKITSLIALVSAKSKGKFHFDDQYFIQADKNNNH